MIIIIINIINHEPTKLAAVPLRHRRLHLFEDDWLADFRVLRRTMAEEPWNRVNIPFPSAVSSVRIHFSPKTGTIHCSYTT